MKTNKATPQKDESTLDYSWRDILYGLAMALCFASSGIPIRWGLEGLPSPLLGVTIGMMVCMVPYAIVLLFQRNKAPSVSIPPKTLLLQILAGVLVGLSTWMRWIALDLVPLAVVAALGRLSVPVVLLLAPFVIGQKLERVTLRLWFGAGLIIAGSFLLTFYD